MCIRDRDNNNPLETFISSASGDIDQKYSKAPTVKQSDAIKALTKALEDWSYIDALADHTEQDKLIADAIEAVNKLNLKEVSEALLHKYNYQSQTDLLKESETTFKQQDKQRAEFEKESAEHDARYDELREEKLQLEAKLEQINSDLLHHNHEAPVSAVDGLSLLHI